MGLGGVGVWGDWQVVGWEVEDWRGEKLADGLWVPD